MNTLISLVTIWWCRWGWLRAQWLCAQFTKVTFNVDEEEEQGEAEEEEEVDLESGDQIEFGDSNINWFINVWYWTMLWLSLLWLGCFMICLFTT